MYIIIIVNLHILIISPSYIFFSAQYYLMLKVDFMTYVTGIIFMFHFLILFTLPSYSCEYTYYIICIIFKINEIHIKKSPCQKYFFLANQTLKFSFNHLSTFESHKTKLTSNKISQYYITILNSFVRLLFFVIFTLTPVLFIELAHLHNFNNPHE